MLISRISTFFLALVFLLSCNSVYTPKRRGYFKIDFPAWRRTHSDRDRRLIDRLMAGERTLEVGRAFGLSPARVSQKRREFRAGWLAYCGQAGQ